jgi:hypothetical protein
MATMTTGFGRLERTAKNIGGLVSRRILLCSVALVVCAHSFMGSPVSRSLIQARAEVNRDLANILSAVEAKRNPELTMEPTVGKGGLLTSADRKYSAYILCAPLGSQEEPERCAHRIHFEENTREARLYEIRGEPELQEITRLIDRLKWVNNFTLSYERWEGPHFGHRYVFDVRSRKQVAAYDLFS